jgi:nicotinamide-nucleotide amidase
MAEGALHRSEATLVVSATGVAGPGASEAKPEGLVCFGLAGLGLATHVETQAFGALGRDAVRAASRDYALELLLAALES